MFQASSTPRGTKVVFNNPYDTNSYNCVKKESIPAHSLAVFRIKLVKTSKLGICMGISTESIITNPKSWAEMMVYSSSNGEVW